MDVHRRLTAAEARRARILVEQGRSQSEVARIFGVHRSTVGRAVRRFLETGRDVRRPVQGRPRATDRTDDRFLVVNALRRRTVTSTQLQGMIRQVRNVNISSRTVRRRLIEVNLSNRRPATGPLLTPRHRSLRLRFARNHVNWTVDDWKKVLFSDETRISLSSPDGRERVWRRRGERFAQACFSPRVPFCGGSVMFWGGIHYDARTELVAIPRPALTSQRYVEEVLEEHVVPFAPFVGPHFKLMHDNARPHSAAAVQGYLREVGINTIDWPPKSPDLNPIEHIWDSVKKRIRAKNNPPTTLADLTTAAIQEWETTPQEDIQHLISGMRRRLQAVIQARGGNTRY